MQFVVSSWLPGRLTNYDSREDEEEGKGLFSWKRDTLPVGVDSAQLKDKAEKLLTKSLSALKLKKKTSEGAAGSENSSLSSFTNQVRFLFLLLSVALRCECEASPRAGRRGPAASLS